MTQLGRTESPRPVVVSPDPAVGAWRCFRLPAFCRPPNTHIHAPICRDMTGKVCQAKAEQRKSPREINNQPHLNPASEKEAEGRSSSFKRTSPGRAWRTGHAGRRQGLASTPLQLPLFCLLLLFLVGLLHFFTFFLSCGKHGFV